MKSFINTGAASRPVAKNVVRISIAFAILALASFCVAQTHQPTVKSTLSDLRADRITMITEAMDFSSKDAAAFWPIYREYDDERSSLEDRRAAIIRQYGENYLTISDHDARLVAEQVFECDSLLLTLRKRYFKKFNKVLSAYTVTKFFQLEHRIDLLMDSNVEPSLPPLLRRQNVTQESAGGSN